jgi:uncharacterized protein (DUF427 family)
MIIARWNGKIVAQSDLTVVVEGNEYFPPESLNREFFVPSDHHTHCFWKGQASYYDIVVDGKKNPNAAWYYPAASDAAKLIESYVAFWHGVEVKQLQPV